MATRKDMPSPALDPVRKMERDRTYAGNQAAVAALELVTALSTVLVRRHGPGFAEEVRQELQDRAEYLRQSDFVDQCAASIVGKLAEWDIWQGKH